MADTHAIDNYEPSVQTLTIPQVLVGTTTYNNVVLKLKDFELLKIDPNPLTGIVDQGFLFQFVSATLQSGQAKLTFVLTSQGKDKGATIGSIGAKARITDEQGNIYDASTVSIRNKTGEKWLGYQFDADIPSTVVITYNQVKTNAKSIALLDLQLSVGGPRPTFKIGNIPFQQLDSTTPFE